MSYNPNTGLVYLPTIHAATNYSDEGIDLANWRSVDFQGGTGTRTGAAKQPREYPGSLQAWDPVKKKMIWSIPQQSVWNAGTLTTAGNVVFQGRPDGKLLAYQAETGKIVWEFDTGLGISAPPITYSVNGRQYIALLVGFGGGYSGLPLSETGWVYGVHTRRLIAFSLEGKVDLPKLPPPTFVIPEEAPNFVLNDEQASRGANEYRVCAACHGRGVISGGMAPDLRASPIPLVKEVFEEVVRKGAKTNMGMPAFPDMTDEQLSSIMHYIRQQARAGISKPNSNGPH
jgi:quinohemoprotein ethanol dehydrogenase